MLRTKDVNLRCFNCGLRITRMPQHHLEQESTGLQLLKQWIYPKEISNMEYICHTCWELASHKLTNYDTNTASTSKASQSSQAHKHICISCGRSILRAKNRLVIRPNSSHQEQLVIEIISGWIAPCQLTLNDRVCIPCWARAQRTARRTHQIGQGQEMQVDSTGDAVQQIRAKHQEEDHPSYNSHLIIGNIQDLPLLASSMQKIKIKNEPTEESVVAQEEFNIDQPNEDENIITLPNLRRAPATSKHCLFHSCNGVELLSIPDTIRQCVIKDLNFYIPRTARICSQHLKENTFHVLYAAENSLSKFTSTHIEDMVFILSQICIVVDFDNLDQMEDHLVHYLLGFSKDQFQQILNKIPRLENMHRGRTALAALLCKLRTRHSGERLSSLFQIPRHTLETLMSKARKLLIQDCVPLPLGLQHINELQVIENILPNS